MREAVWDRRRFLGEEGREEDRGVKKGGCSPWKKALDALKDKEDKALKGKEGKVEGMEDKVAGKAKES